MNRERHRLRPGMTLIEVLIAMTLLAIVGVSFLSVMTSQLRFADTQLAMKDAREVTRLALNALASDVRMVDADSGFMTARTDSFTVLAPYAEGIICGAGATGGSV